MKNNKNMLFSILMIVALSKQVYGSDNNYNSDESDFQKIQCYQEIISDSETYTIPSINKEQNYPIKWTSLKNEFVELGDHPWNNLTLDERAFAYRWNKDQDLPDYLTSERSQVIKYYNQKRMKYAQHCLENITELLAEKEVQKKC